MSRIRAGTPIEVGNHTIVPLERIRVETLGGHRGALFHARKEPAGVLVRDASGVRMLDPGGASLSVEDVEPEFPELREVLERLARRLPGVE